MAQGTGFGKTILFGEHFVVYGLPAIAAGLGQKTIATVSKSKKYELIDNRPETLGYKQEKFSQQEESMKLIFAKMGIDVEKNPVKIELAGDLKAASGVGASAANCVAVARALAKQFGMKLSEEQINEIGFEGEKGYHGTPSGVDNTVSTYGGLLWYAKGPPAKFEKIKTKAKLPIVIANTGKTSNTTEVVASVKKFKEANPAEFEKILEEYFELASEARKAIEANDLKKIGLLMNKNQELLRKITVSNEELDLIVKTAIENGAFGAKLTGTGRGGLAIAIAEDKKSQEKIAKAIQAKGFETIKTTIGD
jgi:mevalonate kinase